MLDRGDVYRCVPSFVFLHSKKIRKGREGKGRHINRERKGYTRRGYASVVGDGWIDGRNHRNSKCIREYGKRAGIGSVDGDWTDSGNLGDSEIRFGFAMMNDGQ